MDKINALEVLHLSYQNIVTTPEIAAEFQKPLPEWINVISVKATHLVVEYAQKVDIGEASAIALAQETPNALLIIDDFKGRRLATLLQLRFTGTIGILINAKQQAIIDR